MRKGLSSVIVISLLILIAGCISLYYNGGQNGSSSEAQAANSQKTKALDKTTEAKAYISIYFSEKQTGQLVAERREIPRWMILNKAEESIVNELLKGPINQNLIPTIPRGTKLISVTKNGNMVIVDFSKEFVDNHPGGSAGETITLYSIVNSLTELKDVEKVKFLIEGKERKEYKGHYEFNVPFERDETIIKRQ
jgi:spore germination protein GerM